MQIALQIAEREGDLLLRAYCEAYLLQARKAGDYQASVARDEYFPFGPLSYVQMLWTKVLRLRSLVTKKGDPAFESIRDTALDLINYSAFLVERLERDKNGTDAASPPR